MDIGEAINMVVETASDVFRDELDTFRRVSNFNPVIGLGTAALKTAGFKNITTAKDAVEEYKGDPSKLVGDVINVGSTAASVAGAGLGAKAAGYSLKTGAKAVTAAHKAGKTAKSVRKAIRAVQSGSAKGQKVRRSMARSPTYRKAVEARQVADTAAANARRIGLRTAVATTPDNVEDTTQAINSLDRQRRKKYAERK